MDFTEAQFEGGSTGALRCAACQQGLEREYWTAGNAPVCQRCAAQFSAGAPAEGGFLRGLKAFGLGSGAGLLGAIGYGAIITFTGYELALITIFIGWFVGRAVMRGSEGRGGRAYQVLAALLTYVWCMEAFVPSIVKGAMVEGDQMITAYRDHGHMLAMDLSPRGVMAELTGRRGGLSKGKGGSMHMFSKEKNFYGGHGIVGAQVPLGTGLAFANRYRENNNVSVTYFGDGAANQGQVYESFNMASLWKLPVIYVIENNRYAMGTAVTRSSAETNFSHRGASFKIPGIQVDGMDVRAVKSASEMAAEWCRSGNGPIILEMQTYRYRGHSMSDPAKYRSKEEVQKMRSEHDPIEQVKARLIDKKWASEDDLKAMDKEVRDIVADAADFAQHDAEPDASELWTDVLL